MGPPHSRACQISEELAFTYHPYNGGRPAVARRVACIRRNKRWALDKFTVVLEPLPGMPRELSAYCRSGHWFPISGALSASSPGCQSSVLNDAEQKSSKSSAPRTAKIRALQKGLQRPRRSHGGDAPFCAAKNGGLRSRREGCTSTAHRRGQSSYPRGELPLAPDCKRLQL